MPVLDEENVRFGTSCVTCHTKLPGGPFSRYEDVRAKLAELGWTRKHCATVCKKCGDAVRLWRDGPKVMPKIILRKRRRRG